MRKRSLDTPCFSSGADASKKSCCQIKYSPKSYQGAVNWIEEKLFTTVILWTSIRTTPRSTWTTTGIPRMRTRILVCPSRESRWNLFLNFCSLFCVLWAVGWPPFFICLMSFQTSKPEGCYWMWNPCFILKFLVEPVGSFWLNQKFSDMDPSFRWDDRVWC